MDYSAKRKMSLFYNSPAPVKSLITSYYGWKRRRERLGRHFQAYRKLLAESQWYTADRLAELQFDLTRRFLIHARSRSEYYRELFDECGFSPERMRDLDELKCLPIQSKAQVRRNMERMFSSDLAHLEPVWVQTGGTSGCGLRFPSTAECEQREFAFRLQACSWAGAELGRRWAVCAGHPVAEIGRRKPPFWTYDRAHNWLLLSSYHLSEENMPLYIDRLAKFRPQLLFGYPSSIYLLAVANRQLGRPVRLAAVVTGSETLYDFQRQVIGESFGCRAVTYYGNAERAANIAECEEGNLHLRAEHSHVELVDADGNPVEDGVAGRMICTAFGNYALPLIRYDIADLAVFNRSGKCPCGRGGIIVESLDGRSDDYVITPDNRYVGRLGHLFVGATTIRMAQIVQDTREEITIRIVPEKSYCGEDEQRVLNKARLRLGPDMRIRFEYVDDIARTKNGKIKLVVSRVKDAFYGQAINTGS